MPSVKPRRHEPFDRMLRRFKRQVERAGTIAEARRREYYETPSAKRHRAKVTAKRRALKQREKDMAFEELSRQRARRYYT